LIFPLLVLVAGRRDGPGFWGAFAVSLTSLAWLDLMPSSISGAVGVRGPMDMSNGTSYAPMLRCFADFTLGVVALRLSNEKRVQRIAAQSMTSLFLSFAIIGLLCLPGTDLAIMLLFPIFIVSISFGAPFIARVLGSAPLHHVGKISYSLYLIHTLLIPYDHKIVRLLTRLRIPAPIDIGLVLSILLAIGVATLTYRWIEVPGRMILRRGFARWRDVPVINPALAPPTNV
jgi:peptidoglycan/LPS O-acetylase OafA/YrhL